MRICPSLRTRTRTSSKRFQVFLARRNQKRLLQHRECCGIWRSRVRLPAGDRRLLRVVDDIEMYIVNPRVRDIWISFSIQSGYIIVVFILGVISNLSPNTATLIGSLGLGTLGVGTNFQRIQKAANKLLHDRRALKDFVGQIRTQIDLCHQDDAQSLAEVEKFMRRGLIEIMKK